MSQIVKKYYEIIVVDDVKSICNSIRREISIALHNRIDIGFRITDFQNPKTGMEYILNNNLDLLISDIKMPFISGEKLVEAVKREKPTLPIIVITGFATKENIISINHSDPNSIILSKPWEPPRLIHAISKLLDVHLRWD